MKAFTIQRYSKTDHLEMADVPKPIVKEDEVLVEIHSASVNQLDNKLKSGEFKMMLPYKLPLILGHDVAGIVVEVGPKVTNSKLVMRFFQGFPISKLAPLQNM